VLTVKWWPIEFGGNVYPGFALAASKEPGDLFPSSHSSGKAIAQVATENIIWLKPPMAPAIRVFPTFVPWVEAHCFAKVLYFAATVPPPYKRLTPGILEGEPQFEMDKFYEWASKPMSDQTCKPAQGNVTLGWAQQALGVSWGKSLVYIEQAFQQKMKENDPSNFFGSDEAKVQAFRNQEQIMFALLKILVTRKRNGYQVPPEWEQYVVKGEELFQKGAGRPRGPKPVKPEPPALPGMPTLIKSEFPGEENVVVREEPWQHPGSWSKKPVE
jgi:hypothetical protein